MLPPRAQEVDLLRTVALVGICLVNLPYLAIPLDVLAHPPASTADRIAAFVSELLLQGKFFVLFSFLFGWGFGVQLAAAARRGADPRPAYLRRLAGLLLIGLAHAALVFHGDILVLYAGLGLVLWTLRGASTATLLKIAGAMVALAAAAYALLGVALSMPEAVIGGTGPSGYLGGIGDAIGQRIADWTLVFPFVLLFNGPLAMGAFALGLAAHRTGFLEPGSPAFARLERSVPLLLLVGLPANFAYAATISSGVPSAAIGAAGVAALAVGSPALAAVYLWAVVRLARAFPRLAPASGRISLSGYVLQGVLAGLVFNGVGLGLHGQIGLAGLLAVALGIALSVELFARLWLSRFPTGPLEAVLRRITYGAASAPSASPGRSARE
jgi:uncharacterized protein